MKYIRLVCATALCITKLCVANTFGVPYYSVRSQGFDEARRVAGMIPYWYTDDHEGSYGTVSVTGGYMKSFDYKKINRCLFGDALQKCNTTLNISGRPSPDRGAKDLLAENFYLPKNYKSTVEFKPVVDHFILDFNYYQGFECLCQQFYFKVYAPLTHARRHLNIKETIIQRGNEDHDTEEQGFWTPNALGRRFLSASFAEYMAGSPNGKPGTVHQRFLTDPANPNNPDAATTFEDFSVLFQPLKHAKMDGKKRVKTRLADIRAALGWNILHCDNYHLGIELITAAPTGNRPNSTYLFDPIVGNGHHWELGAGINGHWELWSDECCDMRVTLFAQLIATHLFKTNQKRTFDLKDKNLSRYMIMERMGSEISQNLAGSETENQPVGDNTPSAQFKNEFAPVANLTSLCVDVSVSAQTDFVFMVNTMWCNWNLDVGYNLWTRSCEKIKNCKNPFTKNSTWALKGDAHVWGFVADPVNNGNQLRAVQLSATQDEATIHAGTNAGTATPSRNFGVDNDEFASGGNSSSILRRTSALAPQSDQIKTSVDPVFLDESDLDVCQGRTKALSHKIFAYMSYNFDERCGWVPYLGLGGHAEFGQNSCPKKKDCTTNSCSTNNSSSSSCVRCSLSQWGIWAKMGVAFE